MDKKEILSSNLKKYMNELDMSAKDLSTLLGCNTRTVNSWLKANYYPNLKTLIKICTVFHISLEELTNSDDISKLIDEPFVNDMFQILKNLSLENYIYVKAPLRDFVETVKKMKGDATDGK